MPKRKTEDDYRVLAEHRGYIWLGPFPKNTGHVTCWQCPRGHEISANYDNMKQGMRCKHCVREELGARFRHPASDYHALAYERGFIWLGPEAKGALEKTVWQCAEGHRWSARYNTIQQGEGCPRCGRRVVGEKERRQPGEYHALAAYRGFTWLGPPTRDNKEKTLWRCAVGHEWWAPYNSIQRGKGCRKCAGLEPKTVQDFRDLAASRGFKWIGKEITNVTTKTMWECPKGHRWPAQFASIKQGSGCPECAGLRRKIADDYRVVAEANGWLWLGPLPSDSKGITRWQCAKGHIMEKCFNAAQQEHNCAECAGLAPKTPEDYRKLALRRDFEWLGPEVPNSHKKTCWMCSKGHQWQAAYSTINQDHGCPECLNLVNGKRVSKIQCRICEMVDGELNFPFGRYSIDIAKTVGDVKIAIEYDSWYFHGHYTRFEEDDARDRKLLAGGWRILHVRSNRKTPTASQLKNAIQRLVEGETWVDIQLSDWGNGPVAWFYKDE